MVRGEFCLRGMLVIIDADIGTGTCGSRICGFSEFCVV